MTKIKCIIFDLCQTLIIYRFDLLLTRLSRISASPLGRSPRTLKEREEYLTLHKKKIINILYGGCQWSRDSLIYLWDHGLIATDEFFRKVREKLQIDSWIQDSVVRSAFDETIFEMPREVYYHLYYWDDVRHTDAAWPYRKERFILGMISNFNEFQWGKVQAAFPCLGKDGPLSFHVLSYEEGVSKPNPFVYEIAFARAWRTYYLRSGGDLKPHECVFVDDKEVNVTAADNFGMQGVHIGNIEEEGWESVCRRLQDLGIPHPPDGYEVRSPLKEILI